MSSAPGLMIVVLAAAGLVSGCVRNSTYVKPEVELPAAWAPVAPAGATVKDARWWTVFNDPALDALIDEAQANNSGVQIAMARIEEARAVLKGTEAQEGVSGTVRLDAARSRMSERGSQPLPAGSDPEKNSFRGTLDVSYEVDLWGRLRSASAASRAELLASRAAHDTVRMAVVSQVAQTYFALRALDEQIAVTRRALASRQESLALQRKRADLGILSEFEYRQREAEGAVARALLPAIERNRSQQESALAVLLGRSPKAIYQGNIAAGNDGSGASPAVLVPEGIPSDLLLGRPDLVEAEQRLIAAGARISAARALYYPAISLTGYLGGESTALGDLFSGPAFIWRVAAGLVQPLLWGGRIDAQVEAATARQKQALAQYQGAIQNAFRDVRDAITAQVKAREQMEAETQRVASLRDALRLARLRYEVGLVSQLEVLDAERNLLIAEQNRIEALRAQRAAIADLFKALGGGWS